MKNWDTRIAEARERGRFTVEDRELSREWFTCACGEQDERIGLDDVGAPVDQNLSDWGQQFHHEVFFNHFKNAGRILRRIESRAGDLIQELEETT